MVPQQGGDVTDFSKFVSLFDPRSVIDDTYKVKAVIDHRFADIGPRSKGGKSRKQLEYQVHWQGYRKNEATWEPAHNLQDAPVMIEKYKKKQKINHMLELNDDLLAVVGPMKRHNLQCNVQQALAAYKLEFDTVNGLRMNELFGEERERVLKEE